MRKLKVHKKHNKYYKHKLPSQLSGGRPWRYKQSGKGGSEQGEERGKEKEGIGMSRR